MQTLFEAANHIAQEIERTRQHLTNLELALEGLKPLITVDAATTTLTYVIASQAQPVEDLSVVSAKPAKINSRSKLPVNPKAEETKAVKTRVTKPKATKAALAIPESAVVPAKLPATGAKFWLKCLGRRKSSVAQIADAALKKLKLEDSAREVMTGRAKAWAYLATKKGELVEAGTRDGVKLYQLAPASDQGSAPSVPVVDTVAGVSPIEAASAAESNAAP